MNKKKVFILALAVCLIAILSMSTLAWFNAADDVTNKFMIADSDGDGTPDFSVSVWENENDGDDNADADGDGDNKLTGSGNTYTDILPGDVIAKNPTVENTGDYSQWIRVYVTFDNFDVIEKACQDQGISSDVRGWLNVNYGMTTPAWTAVNEETVVDRTTDPDNHTVTYVYYYNYQLAKDQTATLFTEVKIPGEFEQQDMIYENGAFSITVKAEALQAENTGTNAHDAFAAYWGK